MNQLKHLIALIRLHKTLVLLVCIVLIALATRFIGLGKIPVSLYWDETAILLDAKVIAATGRDMHGNSWLSDIFPSYGDYKLPIYIWLASLSVKLFGASEFAVRLPSAIAGSVTIVLAGILAVQLAPSKKSKTILGLAAAGLMTLTPWSIMFSRTGFEGHVAQALLAGSVVALLASRKRKWLLVLSVLLGSIATYTYFSVRFVWPVVFSVGYLLLQNKSFALRQLIVHIAMLVCCLLLFIASLVPMTKSPWYEASNQFRLSTTSVLNSHDYAVESNVLREKAGNTIIDKVLFHRHILLIRELLENFSENLDLRFMFITGDPNLRHGTSKHGLFLLPTLPLLFWGGLQLVRKRPQVAVFLACWWILALLPASVPESTPHALRSLNALVPITLFMTFGAFYAIEELKAKNDYLRNSVILTWSIWLCISCIAFLYHYAYIYPFESAKDWQNGYKQLSQIIVDKKSGVRTVWVDPFEDRFYLWLLAFGPYSPQEIQDLPTVNFKVATVDNIVFTPFSWDSLATLDHKVVIVGQTKDIESKLQKHFVQPTESVLVPEQDPRFMVVMLEPK